MEVSETHLPGVGTPYTVTCRDGGELAVLVHKEGEREMFWRDEPDGDSDRLYTTTERQARKLAEIFEGTYFEPVEADLDRAREDSIIAWVEVPSDSPAIGQSIRDVGIGMKTGATVIAVQRGPRTVSHPDATFQFERGDVIVAVGTEDAHKARGSGTGLPK